MSLSPRTKFSSLKSLSLLGLAFVTITGFTFDGWSPERAMLGRDPEADPRPGESPADVDRRLGPWLKLNEGGIAIGKPQGKASRKPDGTETNDYGKLENGTPLPDRAPGLKRLDRVEQSHGTGFMISLLLNSAKELNRRYPEAIVRVGSISQPTGGFFYPPHKSHQNGLDADVLYIGLTSYVPVVDPKGQVTALLQLEKNWEYWQLLMGQRYAENGRVQSIVSMILVDPAIKAKYCAWAIEKNIMNLPETRLLLRTLRPTVGHDDHFHVRLRCSPYHQRCEGTYAPPLDTGCGKAS